MRSGVNPTRRNRNIGTAAQGHGRYGGLWIPGPLNFFERIQNPVWVQRTVGERSITIVVEPPRSGSFYAVTPNDIATVLGHIPGDHLDDLELIALRQPTRKQETMESVWGRFCYYVNIGDYSGSCVILEAKPHSFRRLWRSPGPMASLEIERLRGDGHSVSSTQRGIAVDSDPESIRATQLYRTLPHEVGHNVDYLEKVETGPESGREDRRVLYWRRPRLERERFAHRYADEFRKRLTTMGAIPFSQVSDPDGLLREGLDPSWFGLASPEVT